MTPKTYRINEIFYSIQGEGYNAGRAMVFVRFTGCNLRCSKKTHGFDCDTEFESGRDMTADEIVEAAHATIPPNESSVPPWVSFTGGEPLLQVDADLLGKFLTWHVAIETNGTKEIEPSWLSCHHPVTSRDGGIYVPLVHHLVVSPKCAEHAVKPTTCDELRYVRGHGQAIPQPKCVARFRYISPAFDGDRVDPAALDWCIKLVKENPQWRLSVQTHKLLAVR